MFDIKEELKKLPQKPGVYIMKDEKDEIIYVGKAINLRNRVRQYFQSAKNQLPKVRTMVTHIREFEYIVTDSEMEALILECNLIKKHSPHYNILLKDDKSYPYIKVTVNEEYPRVFITRKYAKDRAKYYGPITDAGAVKETIDTIHRIWPLRRCRRKLPQEIGRERPCLNYHIGQCKAPCNNLISKEAYQQMIREVMDFIEGKHDEIVKKMQAEMEKASEALDFERAAVLRDKIRSVESIAEKQKMENSSMGNADVIAFARAHDEAVAQVFFIRGGKMTGREHYFLKSVEGITRSEVMTAFVKQFYSGTAFIPKEIILEAPLVTEEQELVCGLLSELRGGKVLITVPQKGEKHKLVELAAKNALIAFEQIGERMKREQQRTTGAVEELKNALGLPGAIRRIESYDISNTQGFLSVGSMVVFEDGKPKRSDYRKFRIKTVAGANDFLSMEEVLTRRLAHAVKENMEQKGERGKFNKLPDLILMDGGQIQVHAAESILAQFGLSIPVCGMVKDDRHRTRGLFFREKEIEMPLHSEGFQLVTRIQDEVHRFAIEYHRSLREKEQVHSVLEDIPGIGAVRRKALMRHFGSLEEIRRADCEALCEIPEMNKQAAEQVVQFFRK